MNETQQANTIGIYLCSYHKTCEYQYYCIGKFPHRKPITSYPNTWYCYLHFGKYDPNKKILVSMNLVNIPKDDRTKLYVCDHNKSCNSKLCIAKTPKKELPEAYYKYPNGWHCHFYYGIPLSKNSIFVKIKTIDSSSNYKEGVLNMKYEIIKQFCMYDILQDHTIVYKKAPCVEWKDDIKALMSLTLNNIFLTITKEHLTQINLDMRQKLCTHLLQWGYIKEIKNTTYYVGQKFRLSHDPIQSRIFSLILVEPEHMKVSLLGNTDAVVWRNGVRISKTQKITEEEFTQICGNHNFIPYTD